jgi:serine/threonine protein kinase
MDDMCSSSRNFGKLRKFMDLQEESASTDEDSHDKVAEKSPKGRFIRFHKLLGTGGFKRVYLGFDCDTGREIAWNVVSFVRLGTYDRRRIDSEIKLASTLSHPRILKFITAWLNKEKGEVVFVTERASGGSLRSYIRRVDGPIKLKVIKAWSKQILEGLVYLHSLDRNPVIHRDLKCDNIFVNSNDGSVVIGDLGLCTTLMMRPATSLVGTPEFMAPEVYEEKYGTEVDIYAFGMCLLEMVSRRYPYRESPTPGQIYRRVMAGKKPADLQRVGNISLRSIIETCLDPVPGNRPSAVLLLMNPFWEDTQTGDELAVLLPESPQMESTLSVPSTQSEFGESGEPNLTELNVQPFYKSEAILLPIEELETIQRKQSISIRSGGSSSSSSETEEDLFAVSGYEPSLTKETLSNIPEEAQVESACRLFNIGRIPQVSMFIEKGPGHLQRVEFDYKVECDTPSRIARQLVEADLVKGGTPLSSIVDAVNHALLVRVQEIASRRLEQQPSSIPSHVSTRPPSSL